MKLLIDHIGHLHSEHARISFSADDRFCFTIHNTQMLYLHVAERRDDGSLLLHGPIQDIKGTQASVQLARRRMHVWVGRKWRDRNARPR